MPELAVQNTIDYSRYTLLRTQDARLGGIGSPANLVNPVPVHIDSGNKFTDSGIGNREPIVQGFQNSTLVNFYDVRNSGGFDYQVGTHLSPALADEYKNSVPDEFRREISTLSGAVGQNVMSVGVGSATEQLINGFTIKSGEQTWKEYLKDTVVDVFREMYGYFSPGLHVLGGLTGPDVYKFNGFWGAALVVEPPQLVSDLVPSSIDSLDFSAIESDLHVTIFEADRRLSLGDDLFIEPETNVTIVTPFDPGGFDSFESLYEGAKNWADEWFAEIKESIDKIAAEPARILLEFFEILDTILIEGGVVVGTDIETIVGGKGTTTVHFRDDLGSPSRLKGRVVGEEVVLDYSRLSNTDGISVDLEAGGRLRIDPLVWFDAEELREDDTIVGAATKIIPKFDGRFGEVELVDGDPIRLAHIMVPRDGTR